MSHRFLGLTLLFVGLLGVFSALTLAALDRPLAALLALVAGMLVAVAAVAMLARAGRVGRVRLEPSSVSGSEASPPRATDSS